MANRSSHEPATLPKLGVGVVWWPELDPLCRPSEGLVQVIEAEPETFWVPRAEKPSGFSSRLAGALGHLTQPKLLHGVGAPFGGRVAQSAGHRETLAGDIAAMRPAWISDHLSFNQFIPASTGEAVGTGFLLPPAQCPGGVAQAAAHILHRRASSGVRVAFENPVSYLPPLPGEMPDGVFAAEVARAAECGILLDLHNLLCNERNGRQSVEDFCNAIPLDRVWEIHLAGGEAEGDVWLDAHCGLVEPELMEILADLVPRLPCLGAITFEIIPDCIAAAGLPAIAAMLGRLNDIWATYAGAPIPPCPSRDIGAIRHASALPPALWETALGAAITGHGYADQPADFADWVASAQKPLALYRFLAQEGRASALVSTAPGTIERLLTSLGERATRDLLAAFWTHAAPAYTAAEDASIFLAFVARSGVAIEGLDAVITEDRCRLG